LWASGPGASTPGSRGYAPGGCRPRAPPLGRGREAWWMHSARIVAPCGVWRRRGAVRHWADDGDGAPGARVFCGRWSMCGWRGRAKCTGRTPTMDIGSYVWWRMSCCFCTSRVICKGRLTMEEIILSLKHYWRFVDLAALEFQTLS
jgi:hypothetical protein